MSPRLEIGSPRSAVASGPSARGEVLVVVEGAEAAEIDGLMLLDDDEDLAAGEAPAPQRIERQSRVLATYGSSAITVSDMATPATPLSMTS